MVVFSREAPIECSLNVFVDRDRRRELSVDFAELTGNECDLRDVEL